MNTPFDELDYRILRVLQRDARRAASEIAREVGAQERTVRNRIDRLVELGAVRLTAVVDPEFFGYTVSVDIFIEVEPQAEQRVVECLLRAPEVSYLAFSQQSNEMSLEARFKGNADLYDFLRHTLPGIEGVRVKSYALVPRILRNIDQWFPPRGSFGLEEVEAYQCE